MKLIHVSEDVMEIFEVTGFQIFSQWNKNQKKIHLNLPSYLYQESRSIRQ